MKIAATSSSLSAFAALSVSFSFFLKHTLSSRVAVGHKVSSQLVCDILRPRSRDSVAETTLAFTPSSIIISQRLDSRRQKLYKLNFEQVEFLTASHPALERFAGQITGLAKVWSTALDSLVIARSTDLRLHVDHDRAVHLFSVGSISSRTRVAADKLYSVRLHGGSASLVANLPDFAAAVHLADRLDTVLSLYFDDDTPLLISLPPVSGIDVKFVLSTLPDTGHASQPGGPNEIGDEAGFGDDEIPATPLVDYFDK